MTNSQHFCHMQLLEALLIKIIGIIIVLLFSKECERKRADERTILLFLELSNLYQGGSPCTTESRTSESNSMDHSIDPDPYEFGKMTRNVCCKRSQFSSKSLFLHNTHYTYARIISNISHVQPTCHASLFLTQIFIICSVSIFGCYRSIFQQQPKLGPIHSKEYSTTTHIDWIQTQEITVGRFRSASVRLSSLAGIRETNGQTVRELVCECTTPL